MLRLKDGEFLAIINESRMIEVHAKSSEEATEKLQKVLGRDVKPVICRIPEIISYID